MMLPDSNTSPQNLGAAPYTVRYSLGDFAAIVLLLACLVSMFWKVMFTSAMFFYRDVFNYTYPSARFIHEVCRQGFLPYWNPYLNYGQPLLANPNLLFFYPFTLLIVLLPVDIAYTAHFIMHFAVAGIGLYLLARAWGQTRWASFFAAFVFTFSGPVLSLGNFYNESACAAWIPWAMLVTDRALSSHRPRLWILLIGIFSLQWLAGEPLTMMATFGLCFAYAICGCGSKQARGAESGARSREGLRLSALASWREKISARWNIVWSKPNFRTVAIFLGVGVGMLLLCAAQFLPANDLLSQSRRGLQGLRFRESANWALNPFSLAAVLVPDFFGSATAISTGWLWLMSNSNLPYFLSLFVGFVPAFCALAGWALGGGRRRNFVAGAAGTLLLLSFGNFTPVFALAYLLIPPLAVVRYPVKLLVLVTFLVAILAGWGFDTLHSRAAPWKTQGRRLLIPLQVFLGTVLVILAAAWLLPAAVEAPTRWALGRLGETPFNLQPMPGYLVSILRFQLPGLVGFCLGGIVLARGLEENKSWARAGLYAFALLAMGQLLMANSDANPTVPKTFFSYRPPVLNEFKDLPGTFRVASFWPVVETPDPKNLQTYINFESIPEAAGLGSMGQGAFQARMQLAAGSMVNKVEGNINLDIERSLPPYLYDIEIYQSREASRPELVDCLLGRTNVKYILRPKRADSAATRMMGKVSNGSLLPSLLYEDLCFVPRAYVAGNALFSEDSAETLNRLASRDYDALNTVILAAPAGSSPAVTGPTPAGQVEIVHRDPNSVTLQAQLSRPGYVVLLDRFEPSWHATMDGRAIPVLRANQIFRAVYADAGRHLIRFDYRQRGLRAGVIISLVTLVALVALCFKR